jgi:phosphoribosyl 1,2-cyclic phosphate phosphodiesterase
VVVSKNGANILVDTAPDLRAQALSTGLARIDSVLFTHDHADHIFGLDELRTFNFIMGRPIPIYGNRKVIDRIKKIYGYIWDPEAPKGGGLPMINPNVIEGPMTLSGIEVRPLPLLHGEQTILGFMFDDKFAYMTDCSAVPEETMEAVRGVPLAVIDALRYRPHNTHFSVEEALKVVSDMGPGRALFTHMGHGLDYSRLRADLPEGIEPAYDGMVVDLLEAAE